MKRFWGDKIKKNEMGGACGTYGRRKLPIGFLVGISEGKKPLGKARRRWKSNIKMDPQKVGWGMSWVTMNQCRYRLGTVVNAVMNICFCINCG
jgi:hypothetical protein